jgi:hypothetical protein
MLHIVCIDSCKTVTDREQCSPPQYLSAIEALLMTSAYQGVCGSVFLPRAMALSCSPIKLMALQKTGYLLEAGSTGIDSKEMSASSFYDLLNHLPIGVPDPGRTMTCK